MFKHYNNSVKDEVVIADYKKHDAWGLATAITLRGCSLAKMQDGEFIKKFLKDLVEYIDMEAYGEPLVERFGSGHLYGYSAVQLIHTSCITMHFAEESETIYMDIFSCKPFSPRKTAKYCKDYFEGVDFDFDAVIRL